MFSDTFGNLIKTDRRHYNLLNVLIVARLICLV